ncbi:carbamoyl phosphate synthase small subunit [[Clostridium] symbiosum]|uniref:carbamoyl phosphate synthase small subunit n=1 Tax=Clostridium symbiosum TaxID=1512 RepID=UPI001D076DCB|nr:carbamoyl phosphate synthase small subunit [[Clostridium] symbiosum]MCB6607927.1 carbamoyl phosphate synthase small subunit [[Clostridium] symbiosum]MCB6930428.1 carbamoyl phosphate synthase small subunit [[Clostridium] symbiosum]
MERTVYLLLENGEYFEGKGFGASLDEVAGEVVFTTGMTGYLETITDPSYFGQIVVQTFPMIGNYGVIPQDFENKEVHISAYIVKEWCQDPSNFRSSGNLDTFFKERNIPAVYGIDTRKLAKTIRETGSMNGKLTVKQPPYAKEELEEIKKFRIRDAVENVTPVGSRLIKTGGETKYRVALWDFGAKENILRELTKRGCDVYDIAASTTAEEILALAPDGIMLSNGPGNPEDNVSVIGELKKIAETKIPIFGICLGHQLLAIARGAKTGKMKYGHRGANQPVKDLESGRVYISSQNHGYEVLKESLPEGAEETFINVNDGTCEGITYRDIPAFTVQFHPEACAGPKDTEVLFGRFISMMKEYKEKNGAEKTGAAVGDNAADRDNAADTEKEEWHAVK